MRPHKQQPTRLRHPWDSPGKNTGVGCHCLLRIQGYSPKKKKNLDHKLYWVYKQDFLNTYLFGCISCDTWWGHPTISSSVAPLSCPQSFSTRGSFPVIQLFASGHQSIGASASVLPMNIRGWHIGFKTSEIYLSQFNIWTHLAALWMANFSWKSWLSGIPTC